MSTKTNNNKKSSLTRSISAHDVVDDNHRLHHHKNLQPGCCKWGKIYSKKREKKLHYKTEYRIGKNFKIQFFQTHIIVLFGLCIKLLLLMKNILL